MSQIEKLIQRATTNPENLRFEELCKLCRFFGMKYRKKGGSHKIYKRKKPPMFTLSIQDDNGMAKPYQVQQLLDKVEEHGLYNLSREEG